MKHQAMQRIKRVVSTLLFVTSSTLMLLLTGAIVGRFSETSSHPHGFPGLGGLLLGALLGGLLGFFSAIRSLGRRKTLLNFYPWILKRIVFYLLGIILLLSFIFLLDHFDYW